MDAGLYTYWGAREFEIKETVDGNHTVYGVFEEGNLVGGVNLEYKGRSVKLLNLMDNGEADVIQMTNQIILEFLENRDLTVADLDINEAEIDTGLKYLTQVGNAHPSLIYLSRNRRSLRRSTQQNPLTGEVVQEKKSFIGKLTDYSIFKGVKVAVLGLASIATLGLSIWGISRVVNRLGVGFLVR